MKRNLKNGNIVAVLVASVLIACTQDSIDDLARQADTSLSFTKGLSPSRTYKEALSVAQDAIKMLDEVNTTRSSKPRTVNPFDVQYIIDGSSTRSAEISDTLMYVFNFEDDAGFAIVSANRATEELIAVTEQGKYVVGEDTKNEGFDMYMDMAKRYVGSTIAEINYGPDVLLDYKRETVYDTLSYGPYLEIRWGQKWPYNMYCLTPDGQQSRSGCVATALAQIMTFYEYPSSLTIDYTDSSYSQELHWDDIKLHFLSQDTIGHDCVYCALSSITPAETHKEIGKVLRQLGKLLNTNYRVGAASAYGETVASVLQNLGYSFGGYQAYKDSIVQRSLSTRALVYMQGVKAEVQEGHAWVVDGHRRITKTTTEYVRPEGNEQWEVMYESYDILNYNHINWGWDGTCNGYFSSGVYQASKGAEYDAGVGTNYANNYPTQLMIQPNIRKPLVLN